MLVSTQLDTACSKDLFCFRYIIDYYDGELDPGSHRFALLDVRPKLDSFEAVADRMKASFLSFLLGKQFSSGFFR